MYKTKKMKMRKIRYLGKLLYKFKINLKGAASDS